MAAFDRSASPLGHALPGPAGDHISVIGRIGQLELRDMPSAHFPSGFMNRFLWLAPADRSEDPQS